METIKPEIKAKKWGRYQQMKGENNEATTL
jgi:hypothetical protein